MLANVSSARLILQPSQREILRLAADSRTLCSFAKASQMISLRVLFRHYQASIDWVSLTLRRSIVTFLNAYDARVHYRRPLQCGVCRTQTFWVNYSFFLCPAAPLKMS